MCKQVQWSAIDIVKPQERTKNVFHPKRVCWMKNICLGFCTLSKENRRQWNYFASILSSGMGVIEPIQVMTSYGGQM